jgi:RNA polymerase sigma factor (sigma-70 family)
MGDELQTMRETDDRELLREYISSRSAAAFEELVRRNADMVYSAARRQMGEGHLAEDVTQAVFLLLAQKASRISAGVAGWLIGVTYNACRNARRIAARRAFHERRAWKMKLAEASSDHEIGWNEYAPMVDAAMSRLGRGDRDAIAMRYLRGSSYKDVGMSLGISEEAARKRVDRAIERLRGLLRETTAVPAVAVLGAQLLAKGTEAAPVAIVEKLVGLSTAGTKGALAGSIAAKTGQAMTLLKLKLAAAVVLAVGVALGGAVGVHILVAAGEATPPPPAPRPGMVQSANAAVPVAPAIDEAQGPGQIRAVRWDAILSDAVVAAIQPMLKPEQTSSKLYQTFRANPAQLRQTLAGLHSPRDVIPDNYGLNFSQVMYADYLTFPGEFGQIFFRDPQDTGMFVISDPTLGKESLNRVNGGLQLKLNFPKVVLHASRTVGRDSTGWGPAENASFQFDGKLAPGEALVYLGRLRTGGMQRLNHLLVYETFNARPEEAFVAQSDCGWWIANGPEKMRQWSDAAFVWRQLALSYTNHATTHPSIALEDGKVAHIDGLTRPAEWPGCWWDAAGNSIAPLDGLLPIEGEPPAGLWVCMHVTGPKEEYRIEEPIPGHNSYAGDFDDLCCSRIVGDAPPVEVGVLVGPWREVGKAKPGESVTVDGATYKFGAKAMLKGKGPFALSVAREGTTTEENFLVKLIAVKTDGTEVAENSYDPNITVNKMLTPHRTSGWANFSGMPIKELTYFKVMARKRQWIAFDKFAAEPSILPSSSVTRAQMESAVALARKQANEARLADLAQKRATWKSIAADATNPTGAARVLVNLIQEHDEAGVKAMLVANGPNASQSLEQFAHFLIQSYENRAKLVKLFGEPLVLDELGDGSPDLEQVLLGSPWTENGDGKYSQIPDNQLVMQKQSDGKFGLVIDQLFSSANAPNLNPMMARQETLAERLSQEPAPSMKDVKRIACPDSAN